MDAIECLKTRRSVRVYQNQPVPREIIEDTPNSSGILSLLVFSKGDWPLALRWS
jgi:hypothetical protein